MAVAWGAESFSSAGRARDEWVAKERTA